jgi:hypothetical protein
LTSDARRNHEQKQPLPDTLSTVSPSESEAPRTRWSRSQRFRLSTAGREAGAEYRLAIVDARKEAGRKPFDAARAEWAARLTLDATDGLYLGELQNGPRTIAEMAASLDGCGPAPGEVRKAVERLVKLRMLEPIAPPPAPPYPPRRW